MKLEKYRYTFRFSDGITSQTVGNMMVSHMDEKNVYAKIYDIEPFLGIFKKKTLKAFYRDFNKLEIERLYR